jgi:hypothetical protein
VVIRVAIAVGGAVSVAATWLASDNGVVAWFTGLTAALLIVCVVNPDGSSGIGVVLLGGTHWLVAVDDIVTPWAVVMGAGLATLHVATAAASVAPAGARWTPAMRRRWVRRAAIVVPSGLVTWLLVDLADGRDIAGSGPLVGVALLAVTGALLWARRISVE